MGKTMQNFTEQTHTLGLYDPQFEHDACGIGAVVDIKGRKSHQTVDDALRIVERLEHRAGKDAEGKTGDGVGILLQISHKFFSKVADELNIRLGNEREYGVGMFFFPQNEHMRAQAMKLFEVVTRKEGLEFLAWRKVPVDPENPQNPAVQDATPDAAALPQTGTTSWMAGVLASLGSLLLACGWFFTRKQVSPKH